MEKDIRMTLRLAVAFAAIMPTTALAQAPVEQGPPNVPDATPAFAHQTRAPAVRSEVELIAEPVVEGLAHPWGMAPLPDGNLLVTERAGRLRVVATDGTLSAPVAGLPEVRAEGQGGLLDVTIGPDFDSDRTIYWSYAKPVGGGLSATAVAKGRLAEDLSAVTEVSDIFVQDPPAPTKNHYGSRVVVDAAGSVFVTTGERFAPAERVKAQDLAAGHGKVMRLREDGSAWPDNPFVGEAGAQPGILSYGHRNVQGAALDGEGRLWTIEHGPKGGDELNAIVPGANYGWPEISYGVNYDGSPVGTGLTRAQGMEEPVYYWDPVIAPGGMTFYRGDLFPGWEGNVLVGSMKPGGLVRLVLADDLASGQRVVGEERLLPDVGRVRDVEEMPDGSLLLLIDADDGALLHVTPAAATE
jgi:aldose sugar dehydrogenase